MDTGPIGFVGCTSIDGTGCGPVKGAAGLAAQYRDIACLQDPSVISQVMKEGRSFAPDDQVKK